MNIFQVIYDHEINVRICTFWDGGFDLGLGDHLNGFKERGNVDTWAEVEPWFAAAYAKHYPDLVVPVPADEVKAQP